MITPTILYQHMKKWVTKDQSKTAMQYLYFNGEKVYATDSHRMAIVKNFPVTEAHFEFPQGQKVDDDTLKESPINYEQVLIQEKDICWQHELNFDVTSSLGFIQPWKTAFDFMVKANKKSRYKKCILQKKGSRLYAYCVGDIMWLKSKITLLENLNPSDDWEAGFNSQYLLETMDFLKATEPKSLKIYINKRTNVLTFETEDLLLLFAAICIRGLNDEPNPDTAAIVLYTDRETKLLDGKEPVPETKNDNEAAEGEEDSDEDILG